MRFNHIVRTLLVFLCVVAFSQGVFAQKYEIYPYAGGFWPMKIDEFQLRDQAIWGLKGGVFITDNVQLEGNFGYLNHFKFENANVADFVNLNNITVITVTNNVAAAASGKSAKAGKDGAKSPVVTTPSSVVVTQLDPSNVRINVADPKQRGYVWEANASYNFFGNGRFVPYLTAGVGGTSVTRSGDDDRSVVINQPGLTAVELDQINQVVAQRIAQAETFVPGRINTGTYFTFNYGGGIKGYRLWGPVGLRADFLGRNLPNFDGKALNAFQMTGGVTFAWGER